MALISTSGACYTSYVVRAVYRNVPLDCSVGFKSPATISQAQATAQYDGTAGTLAARGRHDPCVVPRAVPIVEGMSAMVIME